MFKKLYSKTLTFVIIIIGFYFFINSLIGHNKFHYLKSIIDNDKKKLIKKYFFPYKFISQQDKLISQQEQIISRQDKKILFQEQKISQQEQVNLQQEQTILNHENNLYYILQPNFLDLELSKKLMRFELTKKEIGSDIKTNKSLVKLLNNHTVNKFQLTSGFYSGIWNVFPASGFIDFYNDSIVVLSSRGVLALNRNLNNDENNFIQIKNNIGDFINMKQFEISNNFSIKDLLIFNKKIYVSFTEEIKKHCWNTSVIYGDINNKNIIFKKLFSPKECIHASDNIDKEFVANQSGGRIIAFDENNILLSIGDYRNRYLAQDKTSINGKIIKINIHNNLYQIISMGHRNPQGLLFDKENNFILETEHGPQGGDEINLIEVNKLSDNQIQNYGWAISSYGQHYGGKTGENKKKYEKYPLYKSHSEHGFIEPLRSFVPSIGISEIVKVGQNKYVASSLYDRSIYFFVITNQKKIINFEKVKVFERIRDLAFNKNKLYLFMEDTASIGVINLNEN